MISVGKTEISLALTPVYIVLPTFCDFSTMHLNFKRLSLNLLLYTFVKHFYNFTMMTAVVSVD